LVNYQELLDNLVELKETANAIVKRLGALGLLNHEETAAMDAIKVLVDFNARIKRRAEEEGKEKLLEEGRVREIEAKEKLRQEMLMRGEELNISLAAKAQQQESEIKELGELAEKLCHL
jgi:predicted transposase YdaD